MAFNIHPYPPSRYIFLVGLTFSPARSLVSLLDAVRIWNLARLNVIGDIDANRLGLILEHAVSTAASFGGISDEEINCNKREMLKLVDSASFELTEDQEDPYREISRD